ncbi:MAG TPA: hypothetical protein VEL76_12940 [Gemmataceae bacterium]|nr:hypothetical protein [Gemmataceae bacterium]
MTTAVELFNVPKRRLLFAQLAPQRGRRRSAYTHTFGGPAKHQGNRPPRCKRSLVLFYDFDLTDPALAFLRAPGLSRFPIFAPIFTGSHSPFYRSFSGVHVGYRVLSDKAIQILAERPKDYDGLSDFPEELYSTRGNLTQARSASDGTVACSRPVAGAPGLCQTSPRAVYRSETSR